jgi:regulator of nucleoside diphosphate kinase
VQYLDVATGRPSRATIVFPWDADPANARISILAPLATALFGLRVGDSIRWHAPSGRLHVWRVLEVEAERAS